MPLHSDHVPATTAPSRLLIPGHLRQDLRSYALAGLPREACGLLVGLRDAGGARVTGITRARNLAQTRARTRYVLDPAHFLATELDARARGIEVLGVWHSHPERPAIPSETDRAAALENWSYMIVSVPGGCGPEIRSWRLRRGAFVEELVEDLIGH